MEIREATIDDAELLALLGSETFWDTYRRTTQLDRTYIRAYMSEAFTVTKITTELKDANTKFLLAEINKKPVGYSKVVFDKFHESLKGKKPMEISRIYLERSFWGKGYGLQLLEACFDQARDHDCDSVWLGVWRHNERAIRFYEKNGFEIVGIMEFNLASSLQKDHVMEKKLT